MKRHLVFIMDDHVVQYPIWQRTGADTAERQSRLVTDGMHRKCSRHANNPSICMYEVNETVLIWYPNTGSRVPNKRYVLTAKILDTNIHLHRYKVLYKRPDNTEEIAWVGAESVTSLTKKKEQKQRRNKPIKKSHRAKYYIPLTYRVLTRRQKKKTPVQKCYIPLTHRGRADSFDMC